MKKYRIVIHCSATAADVDYTEKQLERDHLARKINSPGGYHFYIRKDGTVVKMRNLDQQGAHALPYNKDSHGICYEGGLKAGGKNWRDAEDTRTENQKASILSCIHASLLYFLENAPGKYGVDYIIEIIGHGQLPGVKKECPSFDAKSEYSWITA
jgi:N-acetylmuramoyl-L-alanine amidase